MPSDKEQFLSSQLIAYIGNKRRLLTLIEKALKSLNIDNNTIFLDLFSGSGSVSRLAKTLGFSVYCNDWEFYSKVINKAYIEIHQKDLKNMFLKYGGFEKTIELLNAKTQVKKPYFSAYYSAPLDADPDNQRMFYTLENGKKLDILRESIDELYPNWCKEKYLLTALLVYEAATHTNTSGVFKAYHRGFGGLGGDALSRILSPISLKNPALYPKSENRDYIVFTKDSNELVQELDWEKISITYIDPPYNQHQYGSNYHILNSVALWDHYPIGNDFKKHGKAGIRKDWTITRSDYCYKRNAEQSFRELISHIHSNYIMISYNTEGIIPFEQIINILKEKGKVSLFTDKYVKYRGGRQSLHRKNHNLEFLILLNQKATHSRKDDNAIEKMLSTQKLELWKNQILKIDALLQAGWQKSKEGLKKGNLLIITEDESIFTDYKGSPVRLRKEIEDKMIENRDDEIKILLAIDSKKYKKRILNAFKKIAHKKYQAQFKANLTLLKPYFNEVKAFQKIIEQAQKREVI